MIIKKRLSFYSMLNSGDTNSCYRRKWNVAARRSEKKLLRGKIIIAKVTLERVPYVIPYNILALGPHSLRFYKRPTLAPKHWA